MPRVGDWCECASRAATTAHSCVHIANMLLVTVQVTTWVAKDAVVLGIVRGKC